MNTQDAGLCARLEQAAHELEQDWGTQSYTASLLREAIARLQEPLEATWRCPACGAAGTVSQRRE